MAELYFQPVKYVVSSISTLGIYRNLHIIKPVQQQMNEVLI